MTKSKSNFTNSNNQIQNQKITNPNNHIGTYSKFQNQTNPNGHLRPQYVPPSITRVNSLQSKKYKVTKKN